MLNENFFDLLIKKRYYHFIVLRKIEKYSFSEFWNNIGSIFTGVHYSKNISFKNFEIQHKRLKSNTLFARGALFKEISLNKDGNPPYLYDLFAIKTSILSDEFYLLIFPFSAMARIVIDNLITKHLLRKMCDIITARVPSIILTEDLNIDEEIDTSVVSLDIVIKDDNNLSLLKIGGDSPLNSDLFKNHVLNNINEKYFNPYKCGLSCGLSYSDDSLSHSIRSRVHMDIFGNFKFYIHIDGKNLIVLPFFIKRLISIDCLNTVSLNPLLRQDDNNN